MIGYRGVGETHKLTSWSGSKGREVCETPVRDYLEILYYMPHTRSLSRVSGSQATWEGWVFPILVSPHHHHRSNTTAFGRLFFLVEGRARPVLGCDRHGRGGGAHE